MCRNVVLEGVTDEHKRNKGSHSQMRTLLMNDNEYNNSSVIIRPNKKTKLHTTTIFPS